METCATCKHWGFNDPDDEYSYGGIKGISECQAVPMFWDATEWKPDGEGRRMLPTVAATAFAQDGSDYTASLYTLAQHGCTMHAPKE